jgi:hypothetical protein
MDASCEPLQKIAIGAAVVWFGHHGHLHNYGYAPLHVAGS